MTHEEMTKQALIEALYPEKVQAAREAIQMVEELTAKVAEMNKPSESDDLWYDEDDLWAEQEEPVVPAPTQPAVTYIGKCAGIQRQEVTRTHRRLQLPLRG